MGSLSALYATLPIGFIARFPLGFSDASWKKLDDSFASRATYAAASLKFPALTSFRPMRTWTTGTNPAVNQGTVAHRDFGGKFLFVDGVTASPNPLNAYTSPDGVTAWSSVSTLINAGANGGNVFIDTDGTTIVAFCSGASGKPIGVSTNGTSFSTPGTIAAGAATLSGAQTNRAAFNGATILIPFLTIEGSFSYFALSTDSGANFTRRGSLNSLSMTPTSQCYAYGNGIFLGVLTDSASPPNCVIVTAASPTTAGAGWTTRSSNAGNNYFGRVKDVVFVNGAFLILADNGIFRTIDGTQVNYIALPSGCSLEASGTSQAFFVSGNTVYVTFIETYTSIVMRRVYASQDGGQTWYLVHNFVTNDGLNGTAVAFRQFGKDMAYNTSTGRILSHNYALTSVSYNDPEWNDSTQFPLWMLPGLDFGTAAYIKVL